MLNGGGMRGVPWLGVPGTGLGTTGLYATVRSDPRSAKHPIQMST